MKFESAKFKISRDRFLSVEKMELPKSGCVAFVGANGSGKSSLAKAMLGELELDAGYAELPQNDEACGISFERQQELIDADQKARDQADDGDKEQYGITPKEIIMRSSAMAEESILSVCQELRITEILDRPYYVLSSGEGRKVLIAEAVLSGRNVIVMDAPFDGLDVESRQVLTDLFDRLRESGKLIVLIVNRIGEIPDYADAIGVIEGCEVVAYGSAREIESDLSFAQLRASEENICEEIPDAPADCAVEPFDGDPIWMENVRVGYQGKEIIRGLSFSIKKGEHWQIMGPNGSGKSTLLSLITGDHPQGYSNKLKLFGRQRGTGETIWDIKKRIGYVSPSFHIAYTVNCSVLKVILSGYFDSIGLYEVPGDEKVLLAMQWLKVIGLENMAKLPFRSLSFGQQRLLLIARALVKHPTLLILDEPLQGLDGMGRVLVRNFVERMIKNGRSQVIFVSHHREDAPHGITNVLRFIPTEDGGCEYVMRRLS